MNTVDVPVRWLTDAPEKSEKALRDIPVIGTFARGDAPARNTAPTPQLYEWREEAQKRRNPFARQRVNQLREREYQHKNPRKAAQT